MAAEVDATNEKTCKGQSNFEIITLSSDEEGSEFVNDEGNFLFKRFILACRPYVTKEAIQAARSLFMEVQRKLIVSHDIVDLLKQYGKDINKENADLYLRLFCNALNEKKSEKSNTAVLKQVQVEKKNEDRQDNRVVKDVQFCDVVVARVFEPASKLSANQDHPVTYIPEIATISDDDDFVSINPSKNLKERNKNKPSTSGVYQNAKAGKTKGETSIETLSKKRQHKKLVSRLKQRLTDISNEIKILNRAELTLEEMDMRDSTYIKENRLKKLFNKTWKKLCKLLGRQPYTGRVVEKPVRASSTGYILIDKAVAKFLKEKHASFPDYFDIRDIVMRTNQKHDLRMSPQVLKGLIADIFTDIGNKLQRRRRRDLLFNFGSHLLDDFKAKDDPALVNDDLAKQLEWNSQISKRNMKQVFTKYAHLERYEVDDKSRRSGVKEGVNCKSGASGKEWGHQRIVKGSISKSGLSAKVKKDMISESSSSENEQDMSRANKDKLTVTVADLDASTLQEISFVTATPKVSTEISLPTSDIQLSITDTDCMDTSICDEKHSCRLTFPPTCAIAESSEATLPAADLDHSTNDRKTNMQTVSNSIDCQKMNISNRHLVTPVNEHKISDDSVKKPSVSDKEANTDGDCEIVDDPKEHFVTRKKMFSNTPSDEPYVNQPQSIADDWLIIVDDQEDPQTMNASESSSIYRDELTFTKQPDCVDQAKVISSSCSKSDKTVQGIVYSNQDSIKSNVTDLNFKFGHLTSVSETNATKACGNNSVDLVKGVAADTDLAIFDDEKKAAHLPKNSKGCAVLGKIQINETIPHQTNSTSTLPLDIPTSTVNLKKRKASVELDAEIPRSTVECFKQITCALRSKKLKLPDSWVNSPQECSPKKCLTSQGDALASPKPTTLKAQSNVSLTSCENNSHVVNGKGKIHLQHRQVFREKTLDVLKMLLKSNNHNVNETLQATGPCSSNKTALGNSVTASDSVDNVDEHEVIIID